MPDNDPRTPVPRMHNFAQFIGSYLALLVGCLEDGENVTPLLSIQKVGESWLEWFGSSSYEHAADKAREKFNTIPLSPGDYALVSVDGYYTDCGKRDEALLIDAFECLSPEGQAYKIIIPYRSASSAEGLAIYQTKLFFPSNSPDIDKSLFLDNLWSGFCHHKEAFEFWNKHRDHSLEPIHLIT